MRNLTHKPVMDTIVEGRATKCGGLLPNPGVVRLAVVSSYYDRTPSTPAKQQLNTSWDENTHTLLDFYIEYRVLGDVKEIFLKFHCSFYASA